MYWSVRRELWENRSIYIAPLAVAGVFLLGFLISASHLPATVRGLSALDPAHQHEVIAMPYDMAAALMMITAIIVSVFYCLDALHAERRDCSILFWESPPVSDLTTVLSKASIPLLVIPLLTFAIIVITQWIMLLLYHILTAHAFYPNAHLGFIFITFFGELIFMLWLLARGWKLQDSSVHCRAATSSGEV